MRLLSFLFFLLFIGFALFARWYYVCEIKQLCDTGSEDFRLQTLQLMEEDKVLLEGYDQFAFDNSVVSPRLNENNIAFLDTVAAILDSNPEKHLLITAFYRDAEEGISVGFFENMGSARADKVRAQLMRRGIEENRIPLDYGISEDSLLSEPLMFELFLPGTGAFEPTQFTFTNMTFSDANFEFDSDEFNPGIPFITYADSLKTYFDLNPLSSLVIVGHTDNAGTNQYNMDLGSRRSKSARDYLKENGVEAKIEIKSLGEQKPTASNETEAGRQKNRRVDFQILEKEGE